MRQLLERLLTGLPFDGRGRRAIDETLLDWAHEEALASSAWQRAWTTTRALAGLTRSVAAALTLDVAHIPYGWLLGRLLLIGLPVCALLSGGPLYAQALNMMNRGVDAMAMSTL